MTEPTDAELDELRQANSGRLNFVTLSEFRTIARAVLARWGQPAHSGEPVAWLSPWRSDQVTTDYDAYGKHGIPLYTAPQADSQPAQVEVADAMADSQYLAGVSAGWNAANADNTNEALRKIHESRAGYLKPLSAARKQGGA